MRIEIDKQSGFCFGVVNAIARAEKELKERGKLYCLGQIVHNSEEEDRLAREGLVTISHDQLDGLAGDRVMIRAHGEPPETYRIANQNGIKIIDASCPVVLKLQAKVRRGHQAMTKVDGQVAIYGKRGHAEIIAIRGQTDGTAYVIENTQDIDCLNLSKPIELFAQTTMNPDDYYAISEEIRKRMEVAKGDANICLLYTSPSPRDRTRSRMPSSA